MAPGCTTTAGKKVKVSVDGHLRARGDVVLYRLYRVKQGAAKGATMLQTYGHRLKLRIRWTAPATPTHLKYLKKQVART